MYNKTSRAKVLVTSRSFGKVGEEAKNILKRAGYDIDFLDVEGEPGEFCEVIHKYDVLIIGGHRFPLETMKECRHLRLICKHGVGVDNIPLDKAIEMGIKVCNAPGINTNAVADLTFGLILDLSRKISYASQQVKLGKWSRIIGHDISGKTLGIIGFGAIGRAVSERAKGFKMKVLAYDPFVGEVSENSSGYVKMVERERLLRESDIISLHLPLTEETRHTISDDELSMIKDSALIINTSRGGVIDEKAAADALSRGRLGGLALDVLEEEPIKSDNPLVAMDDVIITPHMGMYTVEVINATDLICAENAVAIKEGKSLKHCVC